jgi:DNA-binding CsgD family transcriptional regulator
MVVSSKKNRFEVRGLIASFVIIAVCEVFFLMDIYADFFRIDIDTTWFDHDQIEFVAVVTLAFSLGVIGLQIIRLLKRHRQAEEVVETASGELYHVIQKHFVGWGLSPSEKEVAFLLIKGMSTQEIADLRATKIGTVKSQTSSIYQKANLKGRSELVAFFVEDLLSGETILHENRPESV